MPLFQSTRNSDGTYGPTKRGDYYLSKADHRRTAKKKKGKSRWCIKEGEEFSVFSVANEDYFFCKENKALFSVIEDCQEVLGKNGQRVAKFPNTINANDPWHGYPVKTEEKQNRPSSKLLDKLEDEGLISLPSRLKIERGLI